jgi:hypothetical protein
MLAMSSYKETLAPHAGETKENLAGKPRPGDKKIREVRGTSEKKRAVLARRVHYRLEDNQACQLLLRLATKVEGKNRTDVRYVYDRESLEVARGLLDAKHTYRFRIWAAPQNATVTSNVIAGAFTATPLALPEFSGVLSVLFDEYRVNKMRCHIRPVAVGGSTSGYDKNAYAICNDYLAATVPSTWEVCLARAESALVPVCAASGSGFYAFETQPQGAGVGKHAWEFRPPREFAIAGSLGSIGPYIDVAANWPGAALIYAETTASNGTVVMTCWREFELEFRMRR